MSSADRFCRLGRGLARTRKARGMTERSPAERSDKAPLAASGPSDPHPPEQHSIGCSVVLHLLPGALITLFFALAGGPRPGCSLVDGDPPRDPRAAHVLALSPDRAPVPAFRPLVCLLQRRQATQSAVAQGTPDTRPGTAAAASMRLSLVLRPAITAYSRSAVAVLSARSGVRSRVRSLGTDERSSVN
jgi:hypothetical protein